MKKIRQCSNCGQFFHLDFVCREIEAPAVKKIITTPRLREFFNIEDDISLCHDCCGLKNAHFELSTHYN